MRVRSALLLWALVLGGTHCAHSKKEESNLIGAGLFLQQLTPTSYLVTDKKFYQSNVLVTHFKDGTVLVVSSPIETTKTKALLDWIRKELKPKVIRAINTHFHADGTGGNEAFTDAGAEIWSSTTTHQLYLARLSTINKDLADFIKDKELSQLVLQRKNPPANHLLPTQNPVRWMLGDEQVVIFYPGAAHTKDNLVVYLPQQKILFGGCLLRALDWSSLGNLKDGSLSDYFQSTRQLLQFPAQIVIPGHGQHGGKELIRHTMNLAKKVSRKKEAPSNSHRH